jgi:hypothetical protein
MAIIIMHIFLYPPRIVHKIPQMSWATSIHTWAHISHFCPQASSCEFQFRSKMAENFLSVVMETYTLKDETRVFLTTLLIPFFKNTHND